MKRLSAELPAIFLNFISLTAFLGAIAYIAFGLTSGIRIIVFGLSVVISFAISYFFPAAKEADASRSSYQKNYWLLIAYGACFITGIYFLLQGRSGRALISPWETVSAFEFLAYGLGSFVIFLLHFRRSLHPFVILLHYNWSLSVFLIVYAVGYGFDPFIHEAAIKAVEAQGRIYPLTPYYLGEYSLVSVFHTVFGGTIAWWNAVLVPGLAALSLFFAFIKIKKIFPQRSFVIAILALSLPFSFLTISTPQNLAYLWLVIIVIWSLAIRSTSDLLIIWLLSLAALVTQPIAGIPALLFAAYTSLDVSSLQKYKAIGSKIILALMALILPLFFYFFTGAQNGLSWPHFSSLFSAFTLGNPSNEIWWLNFIYLFGKNRIFGFCLIIACSLWFYRRKKNNLYISRYAYPALALLLASCFSMAINFQYLIDYERANYPIRLLIISGIFALPLVFPLIHSFVKQLETLKIFQRIIISLGLAALLSASLYLSYPRFDHYFNSRGYATSMADIQAVEWIEKDAGNSNYVALANQQVSAAALRQYGFKKYYNYDIFYYPIPTGGPLYGYYLEMIKKPSQESVSKAMNLAGVKKLYFILNDYWWAADKIALEAELIANRSTSISNGQVRIYVFEKK